MSCSSTSTTWSMICVCAASTEEKSVGVARAAGRSSRPRRRRLRRADSAAGTRRRSVSRSCASTLARGCASRLSILLMTIRRHSSRSRANSIRRSRRRIDAAGGAHHDRHRLHRLEHATACGRGSPGSPGVSITLTWMRVAVEAADARCRGNAAGASPADRSPTPWCRAAGCPLLRIAPACSSSASSSERLAARRPVRPARHYGCPESCTP